jgi:uncharacterized protein YqjF (DUF2071 family)
MNQNKNHPSFKQVDHRPWPMPDGGWRWRQSWNDLLFVHYTVPSHFLKPLVPVPLKLQEDGGHSWVGIVPFKMEGVMMRPFPDLPGVSEFSELNVRLYVEYNGKPGVWFLSLDASNALAVWFAKTFFYLPYKRADIQFSTLNEQTYFKSNRKEHGDSSAFQVQYHKEEQVYWAKPGSLEHFLTERYCLYCQSNRELYRVEVHHVAWPLQEALGQIKENSLLDQFKIETTKEPPLFMYSKGVDVVAWNLEKIER